MNDHSDTDDPNDDGEGVWSPDIEQCFREALIMFPACGRRKHILQGEGGGKMYGRNELIARHIMMRTGKIRTRKQVSSHIQVLARRKAKAEASSGGIAGSMSPASSMGDSVNRLGRPESTASGVGGGGNQHHQLASSQAQQQQAANSYYDVWTDRPIVTQKIRLVEFSAFIEYRQATGGGLLSASFASQPPAAPLNGLSGLASVAVASSATVSSLDQQQQQQQTVALANQPITNAPNQPVHQMAPFATGAGLVGVPQAAPIATSQPQSHSPHPLASNHQLPTQFNQANNYANGNHNNSSNNNHHHLNHLHHHHHHPHHQSNTNQPLNNNHQHHLNQQQHQQGTDLLPTGMQANANGIQHMTSQQQQQQLQSSTGFTRHSYIKIDYRQPMMAHINKLERIDISQINDKFPEIGGTDGLFQRGPSDAFFLVKFWADLNNDYEYNIEDQNSYFGFSSHFETIDPYKDITCSTKACSYGRPMVEKVEKIYGAFNNLNGRYSYDINRSPMCEFMIQFIKKLRQLSRASQMNSVLENFTVLQVVTSESTSEILLCLAYVFEIASPEQNRGGSQYRVYKLTKD